MRTIVRIIEHTKHQVFQDAVEMALETYQDAEVVCYAVTPLPEAYGDPIIYTAIIEAKDYE